MPELLKEPAWLKAMFTHRPVGVDRLNKIIQGYVVAQKGYLKDRPGQFTDASLQKIVQLMNARPQGLKSRFTHPTLSADGLGKFLGRAKNGYVDGDKVRGDLHLDRSSFNTPHGNLGQYVMDLADSDPDALSSSLVLQREEMSVTDDKGRPKTDENGDEIPPIWMPTVLHASDIVDEGAAVDGLLSFEGLPDALVRQASTALDQQFAGQSRAVVKARCEAYLAAYLNHRYGTPPNFDLRERELRLLEHEQAMLAFVHNSVTAPTEPDWGSVDKGALPRLAFADQGKDDKKSTWGYPHHWVKGGTKKDDNGIWADGTLYLHRGGLNAAWAAAQGAHTGNKAPAKVIDHLQMHRKALGME